MTENKRYVWQDFHVVTLDNIRTSGNLSRGAVRTQFL